MIDAGRKKDNHIIQCNHPYFINLGLGAMTTGTLSDWWNTQNGAGVYINRRNFYPSQGVNDKMDSAVDLAAVFGLDGGFNQTEYFWNGWKPNPEQSLDGRYLRQNLSDYRGLNKPDDYEGDGGPWEYTTKVGQHNIGDTKLSELGSGPMFLTGTYNSEGDKMDETTTNSAEIEALKVGLGPIYGLINTNNWMNAHDDLFPRGLWIKDTTASYGGGSSLDKDLRNKIWSTQAFMEDIKTNKGGSPCVQFSGEVTMYVGETNGLLQNCAITEWVKFNLYLYDDNQIPTQTKGLALPTPKIVAPRRDVATGKAFSTTEDGGWTGGGGDEVAADLDIFLNPVTKKWESGTPNLFAKLVQDIPRIRNSPDIDKLIEQNIASDLSNEGFENRFVVSSGFAMPIRVQNGNNLQWTPNYLNPEDVRCSSENDTEKETLVVYNMSSDRTFRKNEEVMLSRIDGRWIVSQLGIDPDPLGDDPAIGGEAGKWGEFTYLMTNSDYFFRAGSDGGTGFQIGYDPRQMETDFHYRYYSDINDGLNAGVNYGVSGGYDPNLSFNTIGYVLNPSLQRIQANGFVQVTSFDSLDSKLFGSRGDGRQRDACAIASTNPTITSAGKNIPVDVTEWQAGYRNGAHTGGFFGALFPDGYIGANEYFADRGFTLEVKNINRFNLKYLNTDSSVAANGTPFTDDGAKDNKTDPTFSNRNNVINPVVVDPVLEPYPQVTDAKMEWFRLGQADGTDIKQVHPFPAAASLFHEPTNADARLRHLPADVCLNASPEDGSYGSPLRTVHRFKNFHKPKVVGDENLWKEATRAQVACEYISRNYGDDDNRTGSSAFDFQPVNPANIMFRPLKLDAYNQFGESKKTSQASARASDYKKAARLQRTGFEVEIHRTQVDMCRPVAHSFEDREFDPDLVDPNLWDDQTGLKYGPEVGYRRSYAKLQQYAYWATDNAGPGFGGQEPGAFQWANNGSNWDRGGNGFGIITSYTTVRANLSIDFTTDNLYGMGTNIGTSNSQAGNIKFRTSYSWGNDNTSYYQHNCPNLSVRVFHEHPRNQTLYDPRTFAVHHFNPDMRFVFDQYLDDNLDLQNIIRNGPGTYTSRNSVAFSVPGRDDDGAITFDYNTPIPSSQVDYVVPSRYAKQIDSERYSGIDLHQDDAAYQSISLITGRTCYRDATGLVDGFKEPPVMPEKYWQVETQRVGKLLPFAYGRMFLGATFGQETSEIWQPVTIGVGNENPFINNQSFDGGSTAESVKNKIIYDSSNPESGFAVGDSIGIPLKGFTCRVASVKDSTGEILEIEIVDPGSFDISDTNNTFDVLTEGFEGNMKFKIISSENGQDLNWSFVHVTSYKRMAIDPKPFMVLKDGASVVSISATESKPTHNEGFQPVADAQGGSFINKNEETSIIIDQANKSDNTAYDLFFHFHNDISMTWLACKEGYYGAPVENSNGFPVHEQYISARISTT
ncbi:hypothetical protein OAK92_01110 [Crocinitomicaceae bacterium]|nr:hypothetical protein [Crocinitomicaceae bacterium]